MGKEPAGTVPVGKIAILTPRWLTHVFSLSHFIPTKVVSFADARHIGTPLKLPLSSSLVLLRRGLLPP
jgi:hypothetical protein